MKKVKITWNKSYKYIIMVMVIIFYIINLAIIKKPVVEDIEIISGLGYDVEKVGEESPIYKTSFSSYVYSPLEKRYSTTKEGRGKTIVEAIEDRQKYMNKFYISGFEEAVVISSRYAENGIRSLLDERARNFSTNDLAFVAVYDGDVKKLFEKNIRGYDNMGEYIGGLVQKSKGSNFFSDNYKVIDMIVRMDSEGRTLILPHIREVEDTVEIDGLVAFKDGKLKAKLNMDEARILSLLRETNVTGILSLYEDSKNFIDMSVTSKRKAKCYKQGESYNFVINIELQGKMVTNQMYSNFLYDIDAKEKVEKEFSENIEVMANRFIQEMQNNYKLDLLDLGRVAAAKYGRRKDIDWDKVISNSKIQVKVKTNIENPGRGNY